MNPMSSDTAAPAPSSDDEALLCALIGRMADGDEKMVPAKKLFAYSIFYLFAIFAALMIDFYLAPFVGSLGGAL